MFSCANWPRVEITTLRVNWQPARAHVAEYEEAIDTLEKVLDSGIPWEIGLYGEDVEVQMARSEHPTMKAIWDGKIPVINEAFAFQRVLYHVQ